MSAKEKNIPMEYQANNLIHTCVHIHRWSLGEYIDWDKNASYILHAHMYLSICVLETNC